MTVKKRLRLVLGDQLNYRLSGSIVQTSFDLLTLKSINTILSTEYKVLVKLIFLPQRGDIASFLRKPDSPERLFWP
jgi:hypothetical protein